MNFFSRWLWPHSTRREAMSLYKRGMARAEKSDIPGATQAYTDVIELPDSPDDIKAMALYHRALLLVAEGSTVQGFADLQTVAALPMSPTSVKVAAQRRIELQHRQEVAVRSHQHPLSS